MVFIKKSVAKLELAGEEEPSWLKSDEDSKSEEVSAKEPDAKDDKDS